ncbi:MAG: TIM barrel protein [Planctomycetaceae bacterium]|nr:TIM barrel protein [Planctomycetaceae bacterium]
MHDFFEQPIQRRTALKTLAGTAAFGVALSRVQSATAAELKGRIKQSVCLWCYNGYLKKNNMDLDAFAAYCVKLGLKSIELVKPEDWPTLKKHGLICAMTPSHGITKGLNRLENHEECLSKIRQSIDDCADAGFPNAITFSGNREGMDDEEGLKNCVIGLKKIAGYAEEKKVTVCLEYLNSINHKDYMADTTAWNVKLVEQVGSPRVKVLYDIYHAGMMKEDPLKDIKEHADCWGHYHTGGLPGRNEIDDTQTLDYAELMKAIVDSGYQGYVGQEFVPKRPDALESLAQAVRICDV